MSSQKVYLDHLLLQFSKTEFESPSKWLTDHFTIIEGGTHAGKILISLVYRIRSFAHAYHWQVV